MNALLPPENTGNDKPNLRLEIHAGPLAGKGFPFTNERLTMGRAPDNDITLEDAQVSRYHAVLRRQEGDLVLQDLGSTNGTLVNGERIYGEHTLQPTETITIGSSVLSVTGFSAPSTVGMTVAVDDDEVPPWRTYQSNSPQAQEASIGGGNWLLVAGLLALMVLVVAIVGSAFILFGSGRNDTTTSVPRVTITSPLAGSQFQANQRVVVQATSTDGQGITRMELWVGGSMVDETDSPVEGGQSPFTDSLFWTPEVGGQYTLEIRAFNSQGVESAPTTVSINVTQPSAGGEDPDPSPETETPTPDSDAPPFATVRTDLNVRAGPGTNYEIVGSLPGNSTVQISGRNEDESWWQIEYPSGYQGLGWIAAEFAPGTNADNVPTVETPTPEPSPTVPPTPTNTATNTPTPTATPTSVPATATTAPTATPTPEPTPISAVTISFTADPTTISQGECTELSWKVTNIKAVYFNDQGVAGDDNGNPVVRRECPLETTTYRLRVLKQDNTEEVKEITISVEPRPQAPSGLLIEQTLSNGFTLSWSDVSDNEEGFRVYDADSNRVLVNFGSNQTLGTVDSLTCNRSYRLYIVSYNDGLESAPSNIVTGQTAACP